MGAMMHEDRFGVVNLTIDPASVAANTTAEQTFTCKGLLPNDFVKVTKPTNTAGLAVTNARVSAADTLAITFGNLTGSPIDAASEVWKVFVFRAENLQTGGFNP